MLPFSFGFRVLKHALARFALKDYQEALGDCDQAIQHSDRWAEARFNRGRLRYVMGQDYKEATKDLDKAINYNENYTEAYYYRGLARFARKKYEDAIKDYDRVIQRDSNYAEAYENKGYADSALGKKLEATQVLGQAAKIYSQRQDTASYQRVQKAIALMGKVSKAIGNPEFNDGLAGDSKYSGFSI